MAVPFGKVQIAADESRRLSANRDVLKAFVKAICDYPSRVIREWDAQMVGVSDDCAAKILQTCLPDDLPFKAELYFVEGSESLLKAVLGNFKTAKILTKVFGCIEKAEKEHLPCIVLFKIKHLGIWLAHTLSFPIAKPQIVYRPSTQGSSVVQLIPLKSFAEVINQIKGKEENAR